MHAHAIFNICHQYGTYFVTIGYQMSSASRFKKKIFLKRPNMHTQNVCKLLQSTAHKTEEKKQEIERGKNQPEYLLFFFIGATTLHCAWHNLSMQSYPEDKYKKRIWVTKFNLYTIYSTWFLDLKNRLDNFSLYLLSLGWVSRHIFCCYKFHSAQNSFNTVWSPGVL